MHRNRTRPRRARTAAFSCLLSAGIAVGCTETSVPISPTRPTPPTSQERVLLLPDDTTWNTFTTELGVDVTGAYPSWGFDTVGIGAPSRGFGFTLVRSLQSSGVWASVVTFDPFSPANSALDPGQFDPGIARIETDDARSYFRLYSNNGSLLTPTLPDTSAPLALPGLLPAAPIPGAFPRHPTTAPGPLPAPSVNTARAASAMIGPAATREWIDYFIVGGNARTRIRSRLAAVSSPPTLTAQGTEQWVVDLSGNRTETQLDARDGAPVQVSVFESGQLRSRETRTYAPYGEGARALRSSRVEYFTPGASRPTLSLQSTFEHTRLSRSDER